MNATSIHHPMRRATDRGWWTLPRITLLLLLVQFVLTVSLLVFGIVAVAESTRQRAAEATAAAERASENSQQNRAILMRLESLARANRLSIQGLTCILRVVPQDRTDMQIRRCLREGD